MLFLIYFIKFVTVTQQYLLKKPGKRYLTLDFQKIDDFESKFVS
ncbi:hypothetical protein RT42_GL000142 [Enterococcus cecorum DSM 20682 = ATCC 43198]|nr:hypothetical protein RT42_GL000142 [Enterococcus cecorum DSM 20682 = ATCC 43198]